MQKVWIVSTGFDYEGSNIHSVFKNKESAEKCLETLREIREAELAKDSNHTHYGYDYEFLKEFGLFE
jgi:hypothetical protein